MKRLINSAIRKQQLLKSNVAWKSILMNVPPILWFGNMNSDKQKIVTIGANPSNREFFSIKGKAYNRFSYNTPYPYDAAELELAYNAYFQHNPYRGWFGSPSGGRVEAFLNGLDASYYNDTNFTYQAIHIDFFPFATNKKFKDIQELVKTSLFQTGWADQSVRELLNYIKPEKIVVFGQLNNMCLDKYFPSITNNYVFTEWKKWSNGELTTKYRIGTPCREDFPLIICVSAYLGNPRGFKRQDLIDLAQHIDSKI